MNVLIAENSPLYKKIFSQVVLELNEKASVFCAENTSQTIGLIMRKNFNILIINAEIINTDLTRLLNTISEVPILITTRHAKCEQHIIPSADYMKKPISESYDKNLTAVNIIMRDIMKKAKKLARPVSEPLALKKDFENFKPEIILIASSTGGPRALETILSALPKDFAVPALVVQHITPQFTETLAKRLNQISPLNVKVAEEGEKIRGGTIYIAPGAIHTRLNPNSEIYLENTPLVHGVRPAADVLFESVAEEFLGENVLAIVLSGMGSDGTDGVTKLKQYKNCFCITQSEETCVVYGMPRAVVEKGLSDKIVDIENISNEIINLN